MCDLEVHLLNLILVLPGTLEDGVIAGAYAYMWGHSHRCSPLVEQAPLHMHYIASS